MKLAAIIFLFLVTICCHGFAQDLNQDANALPIYKYKFRYQLPEFMAEGVVDPSKEQGERVKVKSPAPEDWSEVFIGMVEELEADAEGDIWCRDFSGHIPSDAEVTAETEHEITYSFIPSPRLGDDDDAKFLSRLLGAATVEKNSAEIKHFNMYAPKPFRAAIIAKIENFDMTASCDRAPDGRYYAKKVETYISGSAMMKKFEEHAVQEIFLLEQAN